MGALHQGQTTGPMTMNVNINVPNSQMTTLGNLVRTTYDLRAVTDMDICCNCEGNPTVSIPVLICNYPDPSKQNQFVKQMNIPNFSNPQMNNPFVFNMNSHATQYPNYYQQAKQQPQGNNGMIMANMGMPNAANQGNNQGNNNNAFNQAMNQPAKPNTNYPNMNVMKFVSKVKAKPIHIKELMNPNHVEDGSMEENGPTAQVKIVKAVKEDESFDDSSDDDVKVKEQREKELKEKGIKPEDLNESGANQGNNGGNNQGNQGNNGNHFGNGGNNPNPNGGNNGNHFGNPGNNPNPNGGKL